MAWIAATSPFRDPFASHLPVSAVSVTQDSWLQIGQRFEGRNRPRKSNKRVDVTENVTLTSRRYGVLLQSPSVAIGVAYFHSTSRDEQDSLCRCATVHLSHHALQATATLLTRALKSKYLLTAAVLQKGNPLLFSLTIPFEVELALSLQYRRPASDPIPIILSLTQTR